MVKRKVHNEPHPEYGFRTRPDDRPVLKKGKKVTLEDIWKLGEKVGSMKPPRRRQRE